MSLQDDKNKIRSDIIMGVSPGVVGVGIDSVNSRLIVFVNRKLAARDYLVGKFGEDFLKRVVLQSGRVNLRLDKKAVRKRSSNVLVRRGFAVLFLSPGSRIKPLNGTPGAVGCFVKLARGPIAALTVRHIFLDTSSRAQVNRCGSFNCNVKIGELEQPGGLSIGSGAANVNTADCAMFEPQGASLLSTPGFLGEFVDAPDLQDTTGAEVVNLASNSGGRIGTILDPDAMIVYPVFVGGIEGLAVFDHQLLIEKQDFGVEDNSGAPVVLNQKISRVSPKSDLPKGAAVGLYSAVIDVGQYHFATPVHACLDKILPFLAQRSVKFP